jgi:environmental stress-induced protein Ves
VRLIAFDSLVATPWKNGGGVTRQIVCFPPGSDLTDFDWRISTAEVTQDGPFSRFDGIDRRLYVLEGAGLDLAFAGGETRRLPTGAHADFAGEAEVTASLVGGPVTDLNIMVRRARLRLRAERLTVDGTGDIAHGWGTAVLFVLGGEITVAGERARHFDTVLLDGRETATVSGSAELLLIGFAAAG